VPSVSFSSIIPMIRGLSFITHHSSDHISVGPVGTNGCLSHLFLLAPAQGSGG
jgi:hypothetical protein